MELDNLEHVLGLLAKNAKAFGNGNSIFADSQYCPKCGDKRRMAVFLNYLTHEKSRENVGFVLSLGSEALRRRVAPSILTYVCLQCSTTFTACIYSGPDGPAMAVFQACRGGLTTPYTPPEVAYFLDQAHRSHSVGACSAAISMFRVAADQLLQLEGYTKGMLGVKIAALEKDIAEGKAPKWALDLGTEILDVLRDLGNGALHANGGDVSKQAAFDTQLLHRVKAAFQILLNEIYEVPKKRQALLAPLKAAAASVKPKKV